MTIVLSLVIICRMKQHSTRRYAAIAMMSALIAVLSLMIVPLPSGVPLTLQTFAIAFCGLLLGWRSGVAAVAVYLLLGAIGVPVFAGGKAGVQVLVSLTGGFLWGFLPMAALCGAPVRKLPLQALLCVAGLALCHAAGVLQFAADTRQTLLRAAQVASFPFLIKDLLSTAAALALARPVRARLGRILEPAQAQSQRE